MPMSRALKRPASLSTGLLARKGQARPAMRPQAIAQPVVPVENPAAEGPPPVLEQLAAQGAVHRDGVALTLDAERLSRLKLASAAQGRSAQAVMAEALDEYLASRFAPEAPLAGPCDPDGNR
jgi:hypothetical protein